MEEAFYDSPYAYTGNVAALARKAKVKESKAREYLERQNPYTLFRPVRRRYKRAKTLVGGLDAQWQADLADMRLLAPKNKNHKFILTIVDVLSRYGWAIPLKDKTGEKVAAAFKNIFESEGRIPKKLQTDEGLEFRNKHLRELLDKHDITWFATKNRDVKASMVERFNRTLKKRLFAAMNHRNTQRWLEDLPVALAQYNSRKHSAHGLAPREVTPKNQSEVWRKLYGDPVYLHKDTTSRKSIPVGTPVVLSTLKKSSFADRGYVPRWTEETFRIKRAYPVTGGVDVYELEDGEGEAIKGRFYKEELQRVSTPRPPKVEERVLKREKGRKLVKWRGHPEKFNTWVPVTKKN